MVNRIKQQVFGIELEDDPTTQKAKLESRNRKTFIMTNAEVKCIPLKDPTGKFLGISLYFLPLLFDQQVLDFKSYFQEHSPIISNQQEP